MKKYNLKNKTYVTLLGLSYKPNVSDLRNSLALNIFKRLKKKYINLKAFDPIIDKKIAIKNNIQTNFNSIKKTEIFVFLVKHKKIDNN